MNSEATKDLESLRDLEGVIGSFVVNAAGGIFVQDLPSYFGSAAYEVGPRALRLGEVLRLAEGDVSQCVLRYGSHKIALRPVGPGYLTVLASQDVNVPALRMATTLVSRKLKVRLVAASVNESSPPPPTVRPTVRPASLRPPDERPPSRGAAAPEAAGAHPPTQRAVYFRGKRIK